MTKRLFIITIQFLFVISMTTVNAQERKDGIHFEQKLKWGEILAKAKTEHKYIFVDCYATWCGPCKLMEQTVYPQKAVGDAYNKDFISVKMQMDQTAADDSLTKSRYSRAKTLEKDYAINAYPTFLFFDANGEPVHKVTGALDIKGFTQLAKDAQNPDKQYYAILKNFQPGKLDTADEKGLVNAFAYSDHVLAGKIASDYLSRVPVNQLTRLYKGRMMVQFQDNPQILNYALAVIRSYNKADWIESKHAQFLGALSKQKQVQELALKYIKSLTYAEIAQPDNINFIRNFSTIGEVRRIAKRVISQLPDKNRYNQTTLRFIEIFTDNPKDPGFYFYYNNAAKIDSLLKQPGDAEYEVYCCIANAEWKPMLEQAKRTGITPDFGGLKKTITEKYTALYALQIGRGAVLEWYKYLVDDKKQGSYWPQLISAELAHAQLYLTDKTSVKKYGDETNNGCWDAFLHSADPAMLRHCDSLMTQLLKNEPNDFIKLDTYASLLYKGGRKNEGIAAENRVLTKFDTIKHLETANFYRSKIEAMKRNEKIWLDPTFQN